MAKLKKLKIITLLSVGKLCNVQFYIIFNDDCKSAFALELYSKRGV